MTLDRDTTMQWTKKSINKEVHISSLENEEVSVKCRCGRGARKDDSAYLTCLKSRCLCFKQNLPCNMNCQCKNCNNPKGSTRKRVAEVIPRAFNQRKRRAHTTKTTRDNAFYSPRLTVKYPWKNVEIYLLLQLIESLGLNMNCLQSEMFHEAYNSVVHLENQGTLKMLTEKTIGRTEARVARLRFQKESQESLLQSYFS